MNKAQEISKGIGLWKAIVAALFVIISYAYSSSLENYSTTPKWIALVFLAGAILMAYRKKSFNWSLALAAWTLFIFQYVLQCWESYNFWDGLIRIVPMILAPLIVLIIFHREKNFSVKFESLALIVLAVIAPLLLYTCYDLIDLVSSGTYTRVASYQVRYSFGHKNQYAQFLTLVVPLLISGLFLAKTKWKKYVLLTGTIVIYLIVTVLMNRTCIIVLYTIYPVGLIVLLIHKYLSGKKRIRAFIALSSLGLITVLVMFSSIRHDLPIVGSLTKSDSAGERIELWKKSIEIWKEKPIVGHGSHDWKIEILTASAELREAHLGRVFFQRAHNEFFQIGVENGLIGVLIFISFFLIAIYGLARSKLDVPLKITLISGVVAFMVVCTFSFPLERVELLILLFMFIIPASKVQEDKSGGKFLRNSSITVILAASTVFIFSWYKNESALLKFKTTDDIEHLDEIDKEFYSIDATSTPLYWFEGNYHFERKKYRLAVKSYKRALKYNPNHVHVLNNMGSSYFSLNEADQAEKYYLRALEINPVFVESLMNFASICFDEGKIDDALIYLKRVPLEAAPENHSLFLQTIVRVKIDAIRALEVKRALDMEYIVFMDGMMQSEEEVRELFESYLSQSKTFEVVLRERFNLLTRSQ